MTTRRRTALVTGASAGIGKAFAHHLAEQGFDLLLVARRADRLAALANELHDEFGVRCESFGADLTDPTAPAAIVDHAAALDMPIDVLINNAGLSGKTAFTEASWEAIGGELQLMVMAVTELAHRLAPGMKERRWGRIVNLSSLAAFSPPGESLIYTGIKSYVLNMSQSLNMELAPHGVHVTALCPGFTHSEFHDVMGTRDSASALPGVLWQEPEDVVREGWSAVEKGKPVCVPGFVNKVVANSMRPVPFTVQYHLGRLFNPFKNG